MEEIVKAKNLRVTFEGSGGLVAAVRGVCLTVFAGEIFALVGESGCGKSVTAQALLGLHPTPPAHVEAQTLRLGDVDLLTATEKTLARVRGGMAGMVFQNPMSSLNPTMRIGNQITERLRRREGWSRAACRAEAVRLLKQVRISDAALRAQQYPHQLSGGMRQRVMIAMALAGKPQLLVADEPTTALDATTQLEILRLLAEIRREQGTAVLLITHDFGVVANLADRVAVMYGGKIVEEGQTAALFDNPIHPYTRELLEGSALAAEGSWQGTDLTGCAFAPRCPHRMRICLVQEPPMFTAEGYRTACFQQYQQESMEDLHGENSI